MPKTHFPRSGGQTWVQSFYDEQRATGDTYYVGSTVTGATDGVGYGRSPEAPFATLAYALNTACTANNGDLVIVLPGHTEAVIAAGTITASKAGVTVRGIGVGRARPVITYTTAIGASVNVTAANVWFDNIVFSGVGFAAVTAMVNVSAADCRFTNCEFEFANATNQAVVAILTTAAANRLRVEDCHFHGTNNAGTTTAIQFVGVSDSRIQRNIIAGAFTAAFGGINIITTAAVNLIITDNLIQNLTAVATKAIVDTITASTGQISRNLMQILSGTAPITGATFSWVGGNYYGAALGALGVLI